MAAHEKCLVSIVIPTYNHATFLKRALDSLISQTYPNWEALIVDNHSIDHTTELISSYNEKRFQHIKIHNNGIIAMSRNEGIKQSKGKYVAFLDSDDWWDENKLFVSVEYLEKLDLDLIYHDSWLVKDMSDLRKEKFKTRKLNSPVFLDLLVRGNAIINSTVVLRSSIIKKVGLLDESRELIACEDYDFWLKVANVTDSFFKIEKCLGYYWYGGDNLSKNKNYAIQARIILRKYKSNIPKSDFKKAEAFLNYHSGLYNKKSGDRKIAIMSFLKVIWAADVYVKLKAFYHIIDLLRRKKINKTIIINSVNLCILLYSVSFVL